MPSCYGCPLKTQDEFENQCHLIHNYEYDYTEAKYINSHEHVIIKHNKCGNKFEQAAYHHMQGTGCPTCNSSKGELYIHNFLNKHDIEYQIEKRFDDCKNINTLPFDVYIPSKNILIEFQGIQHFKPIDFFGGVDAFEKRKKNDDIKKMYCKNHNYILIEIRYDDNIEAVMNNMHVK